MEHTYAILLVDDHPDTLEAFALVLKKRGHRVSTAETFAEAVDVATRERFDILITDAQLPDGWGWDLMDRVKRLGSPVTGIVVSAHGFEHHRARSLAAGFCTHLTKPVTVPDLLSAIDDCAGALPAGTGR